MSWVLGEVTGFGPAEKKGQRSTVTEGGKGR